MPPEELSKLIENYINQLSQVELIALNIAKEHLKSSFDISKSIGFLNYVNNK